MTNWKAIAEKLRLQLLKQADRIAEQEAVLIQADAEIKRQEGLVRNRNERIITLEAQIDDLREQVERLLAEAAHA